MKKCQRQWLHCKFKKDGQGQWRAVGTTHSLITVATARAAGVIAGYVKPDITFGSAVGAGPGQPLTKEEIAALRRVQKDVTDLAQQPEESAKDFLKRVAKTAYEYREATGYEACTLICADKKGSLTANLVTQSARTGCLPDSCPENTSWLGKGIHSHGKNGRATLTDAIFNGESLTTITGIRDKLSSTDLSNNMNDGLATEDGLIWEDWDDF